MKIINLDFSQSVTVEGSNKHVTLWDFSDNENGKTKHVVLPTTDVLEATQIIESIIKNPNNSGYPVFENKDDAIYYFDLMVYKVFPHTRIDKQIKAVLDVTQMLDAENVLGGDYQVNVQLGLYLHPEEYYYIPFNKVLNLDSFDISEGMLIMIKVKEVIENEVIENESYICTITNIEKNGFVVEVNMYQDEFVEWMQKFAMKLDYMELEIY